MQSEERYMASALKQEFELARRKEYISSSMSRFTPPPPITNYTSLSRKKQLATSDAPTWPHAPSRHLGLAMKQRLHRYES
jgi:hypothetical protein